MQTNAPIINVSGNEISSVVVSAISSIAIQIVITTTSRWPAYAVTGQHHDRFTLDVEFGDDADNKVVVSNLPFPFFHLESQNKDDLTILLVADHAMAHAISLTTWVKPPTIFHWLAYNHEYGKYQISTYELTPTGSLVFLYTSVIEDTEASAREALATLNIKHNRNWPLVEGLAPTLRICGFDIDFSTNGYLRSNLFVTWDETTGLLTVDDLKKPEAPATIAYNAFFLHHLAKLLRSSTGDFS